MPVLLRSVRPFSRLQYASFPLRLALLITLFSPSAQAVTLDLATVQSQAVEHSFALKIADSDIVLRALEEQEARSRYLPTLALRYDFGYAWALDNNQGAVTIGDSASTTDLSTWRNSVSASTTLLLYDSGAREEKLARTRHGLLSAEQARADQLQQVRLQTLEVYVQGLQSQCQVATQRQIVAQRKGLFRVLQRLRDADAVAQTDLQDMALKLAASLTRLDDVQTIWHKALAALTELTGDYSQNGEIHFAPLPIATDSPIKDLNVEQLPQIQVFDEELAALRAERSAVNRGMYPLLGLNGSYRLYGADPGSGKQALAELSGRDATLTLVLQWEFSGFRDRLQLARLDEQLRRLGWQRQQRIAELERETSGLLRTTALGPEHEEHSQGWRQAATKVALATVRLREQELLDELTTREREIELLEQFMADELQRNRQQADLLRLQIWQGGAKS